MGLDHKKGDWMSVTVESADGLMLSHTLLQSVCQAINTIDKGNTSYFGYSQLQGIHSPSIIRVCGPLALSGRDMPFPFKKQHTAPLPPPPHPRTSWPSSSQPPVHPRQHLTQQ
jgi:hypothetical protein